MGKRGFDQQVQTGLPAGQYCDLISNCQQKITVDGSGNARVRPYSNSDPVVAIIQGIWQLLLDRHFESFSESHAWKINSQERFQPNAHTVKDVNLLSNFVRDGGHKNSTPPLLLG